MRTSDRVPGRSGALFALAAAVSLTACAKPATTTTTTAATAAEPTAGDPGFRTVVSRTDIRGREVGTPPEIRATVVVVFASWCRPCREELALLREMSADRPGLRVIGVNAYEDFDDLSDEQRLVAFLTETHPWLTVVRADPALLRSLGGVRKIPSLFVYDQRGARIKEFRRSQRKPPTRDELARLIDPLLG